MGFRAGFLPSKSYKILFSVFCLRLPKKPARNPGLFPVVIVCCLEKERAAVSACLFFVVNGPLCCSCVERKQNRILKKKISLLNLVFAFN